MSALNELNRILLSLYLSCEVPPRGMRDDWEKGREIYFTSIKGDI